MSKAMDFDATITLLNDRHFATTGLFVRRAACPVAVRQMVEQMAGAGWIDVEAGNGLMVLNPADIFGDVTTGDPGPSGRTAASRRYLCVA
jgi:hypothetical protein